jgi:multidrug resistance efflux pump
MDTISPVILTSRVAQEHFNKIKADHEQLLQGMQAQAQRVTQFNADKDARQQEAMLQAQDQQAKQEKELKDSETKRLEAENKAKELAIKQAALML